MNTSAADLTYQIFDKWMVLEPAGVDKNYTLLWKCQCSCGKIAIIRAPSLLSGKSTKCVKCRNQYSANKRRGVKRKISIVSVDTKQIIMDRYILGESVKKLSSQFSVPEKTIYDWLKKNNIPKNKENDIYHKVFSDYKWAAKNRGIEFLLSKKEIYDLIVRNCHYCGINPSNRRNTYGEICFYNGIDRIDSNIGYIKSNVVSCCSICNSAKNDMSLEEFKIWLQRAFSHMFNKGEINI